MWTPRSRRCDEVASGRCRCTEAPVGGVTALARSQWTIENRLHFVRDTAFAEDTSTVRTGHGPDNMATLRSFAINTLRAAGHTNIAAGLREMSYDTFRHPLDLLGLT